jgi:hypothetical protein
MEKIKVLDIRCLEVQAVKDLMKSIWGVFTSVGKGLHVAAVHVFVRRLGEIDCLMLTGSTILDQCCVHLNAT